MYLALGIIYPYLFLLHLTPLREKNKAPYNACGHLSSFNFFSIFIINARGKQKIKEKKN